MTKTNNDSIDNNEEFVYRLSKPPADIFMATWPDNKALSLDERKLLAALLVNTLEQEGADGFFLAMIKGQYCNWYGMYEGEYDD